MNFYEKREEDEDVHTHTAASPGPSSVSIMSGRSTWSFCDGTETSDPEVERVDVIRSVMPRQTLIRQHNGGAAAGNSKRRPGDSASPEPSCVSIRSDRSMMNPPEFSDEEVTSDAVVKRDDVITSVMPCQTPIMQHNAGTAVGNSVLQRVKNQHKISMKAKYGSLSEGFKLQENQTLLNRIYTQLNITDEESQGLQKEQDKISKKQAEKEKKHR